MTLSTPNDQDLAAIIPSRPADELGVDRDLRQLLTLSPLPSVPSACVRCVHSCVLCCSFDAFDDAIEEAIEEDIVEFPGGK